MPIHDWTRVSAEIFHDFHLGWITHLTEGLNGGLLPSQHYAQIVQSEAIHHGDVNDLATEYRQLRRTIAIRHTSGHQVVALIEIVSPANKDSPTSVHEFVEKLTTAVKAGIHVLLVDLFPPSRYDPRGLHGEFWQPFDLEAPADVSAEQPLCLASYEATDLPEAWIEPLAIGDALPDMPLFYERGLYVNVSLEATYAQAWRVVPGFWKDVVEGRATA
jgi:hypothetical protein